jgi:hypothetical protein
MGFSKYNLKEEFVYFWSLREKQEGCENPFMEFHAHFLLMLVFSRKDDI